MYVLLIVTIAVGSISRIGQRAQAATIIGKVLSSANTSDYNARITPITGSGTATEIFETTTFHFDFNGDGVIDPVIRDSVGHNGTNGGTIWILDGAAVKTAVNAGQDIALDDNSFNLVRISGAETNDQVKWQAGDLNNDNKADIVIYTATASGNSRSGKNAAYIIYNDLLRSKMSSSKEIDLANSADFNVEYTGEYYYDNNYLQATIADLNNDGSNDLLVGIMYSEDNSIHKAGSLFFIYNSLIPKSGTGNVVDITNSANFNVHYEGQGVDNKMGTHINTGDFDNDGKTDIIYDGYSYGPSAQGTVWLISQTKWASLTGTGNVIDMSTTGHFSYEFIGSVLNESMQQGRLVDFNGDGKMDLITDSLLGATYIIDNSFIADPTATDVVRPLSTTSNYTLRINGVDQGLGRDYSVADYDYDGKPDLLLAAAKPDLSHPATGSTYLIPNRVLTPSGAGNVVDISDTTNYNFRFDGQSFQFLNVLSDLPYDYNGDGRSDFVFASVLSAPSYILLNFPHTLNPTKSLVAVHSNPTITGTVSLASHVDSLASVQYSVDTNNPSGSWTDCSIASTSYSCEPSISGEGRHIVYVRAQNQLGLYTAQNDYAQVTVTLDQVKPHQLTLNAPQYVTDGNVSLNGFFSDDRSGFNDIKIWGSPDQPFTATSHTGASWSTTLDNVPDGIYRYSAYGYDQADNETSAIAGNDTIVDSKPPTLIMKVPNHTSHTGATVAGYVTDAYAGVASLVINNIGTTVAADGSFSLDLPLAEDSELNTITVVATDKAGNSVTKTYQVQRDLFSPDADGKITLLHSDGTTTLVTEAQLLAALASAKPTPASLTTVKQLQGKLAGLGYYHGKLSGRKDYATRSAIRNYQINAGLKPTSLIDQRILYKLDGYTIKDAAYILAIASKKSGLDSQSLLDAALHAFNGPVTSKQTEEVKFMQKRLYLLGFYSGPINGLFDSATQSAVRSYRSSHRLGSGLADQKFIESLNDQP